MPETELIAKNIAIILTTLAKKIEENPEITSDLGLEFLAGQKIRKTRKAKEQAAPVNLDVFKTYAEGGEEALRVSIKDLKNEELKAIIQQNSLLPGKIPSKKKKVELIDIIIKRVKSRMNSGDVFMTTQPGTQQHF